MRLTSGPYAWPMPDEGVREALEEAYRDGTWGQYDGPARQSLEAELCQYFGVTHALLCSSGTIGVELALRGCGVGAADEVILAGYDFSGNFRAVEAIGARPVLVDVRSQDWCMDVESLESLELPRVKAVIVSHLHGGLADLPRLMELAARRGWMVVEDACQQPGAVLGDRRVGSWGHVGVLSFGGSKLLTAGRGGAVLTSDPHIAQRIKVFADRGNQAFPMSELQAAVLRPQLRILDERNQIRLQRVALLRKTLASLNEVLRPLHPRFDGQPAFFKVAWSFVPAVAKPDLRENFLACLREAGAPVGAGFRSFHLRSKRRCAKPLPLENSRSLSQSTVLLHHPILLAHEKAARELTNVLDHAVRQVV